jgi:hypothetical protein
MCAKVCWDLLVYWGLTSVRYVHGLWHDPEFTKSVSDVLDRGYELNARMQAFFREWHAIDDRQAEGAYVALIPFAAVGLRRLDLERPVDADGLRGLLAQNLDRMEGVAVAMFHKASNRLPDGGGPDGRAVNPYAVTLDSTRWSDDGLFEGSGLTQQEALERAEGIQTIWLDQFVRAPST